MSLFPPQTAFRSRTVPLLDPSLAVACLRAHRFPWLLESSLWDARLGRYSFFGADPYAVARIVGNRLDFEWLRAPDATVPRVETWHGDPLERLRRLMPPRPIESPPAWPFAGGAVGYFGYELAAQFDVHEFRGRDDLALPDATWLFVDRVIVVDHQKKATHLCGLGFGETAERAGERADAGVAWLEDALAASPGPAPWSGVKAGRTRARDLVREEYAEAVETILEKIRAGDVYQGCLTARADRACEEDPFTLYQHLRKLNPAPFAAYLELPEVAIVSSSPERFLRVSREGVLESRPIKGTAPRSGDPVEDEALRNTLLHSLKDRAENVMIVDLVRNDLGRVCEVGSVAVPELLVVEAYAAVFQLVSTVVGRLAPGNDVFDAIHAAFPPGSMTGAPKIAAMKILDQLEPVRRAIYSGALGYLDAWGGADLSVVIRTLLVQDGRAFVHAGGGIVADSTPDAEYAEALAKLGPLLAALEQVSSRS